MKFSLLGRGRWPRNARCLVMLALALALTACIEADYRPTSSTPTLPAFDGIVEVLKKFPPGEHMMLGTLFIEGGLAVTKATMLNALRSKAAAVGANAIVMQGKLRSTKGPQGTRTKLAAWAIRKP